MRFYSYIWHDVLKRPHKLAKTIDTGVGSPTVLLIHGLGASGATWEPLVSRYTNGRLIGYDLLGFGISPRPDNKDYSTQDHAEALLASLKRDKLQGPLIIIGHSMGCLIASHLATIRPALVQQLILYEPPLFADSAEFRSHTKRRQLYFSLYERLLKRPDLLFKYSKFLSRIAEGRAIAVDSESWLPFERSLKNTIMKQESYTELKNLSLPTHIIYGSFDFVVTRTEVKRMLQTNPHITFHLVNEMHDITPRAAKYIIKLLEQLY